MPRVCPRPCGRLTTAAVFISVGVVQLLVGIILLRSKFADLLAGPDFMTASSNVGIGCVYGMAATVWKSKKKLNMTKENAKNNVLASLLVSLMAMNATTFAVLLMGDGSELLSSYMQTRHLESSASLANEVLAGAYITSVCSPIVCIVVAIVALSGICFQTKGSKQSARSVLNIETPFDWNPKTRTSLEVDDIETPFTEDSSPEADDNVFSGKSSRKFKLSDRYVSSPQSRWDGKYLARNSLKKRLPLFSSSLPKIEHLDKDLIPRIKKTSFLKKSRLSQSDEALSYWGSVKVVRENALRKDSKSEEARRQSALSEASQSTNGAFRKDGKSFSPSESNAKYVSFESPSVYTFASPQVDDPRMPEEPVNLSCMRLRIETLKELKTRIKRIPTLEPTLKNLPPETRSLGKAVPIPSVDYERTDSSGITDSEASEDSTKSSRNRSFSNTTNNKVCTPDVLQQYNAECLHTTIVNGIRSKSLSTPPTVRDSGEKDSASDKRNLALDNPKVIIKQQNRKLDAMTKRMASISEVSVEEFGSAANAKRSCDANKKPNVDENSSVKDLTKSQSGKSKQQGNPSIKNKLKGIWSSSSEAKMDILELIMDQDSLIGLSEDELMSRTRRIRELRKTVSERLKTELKEAERKEAS